MATVIRYDTAPRPNGCRWCGVEARGHAQSYAASKGWHQWEQPTPEQINARMRARRGLVTR